MTEESGRQRLGFSRTWLCLALAVAVLLGLGGRLWLASLAPRWAYNWDHFDNVCMGKTASSKGLFKVYSVPVSGNASIPGWVYNRDEDRFVIVERKAPRVANYPPLGVAMSQLQASMLPRPLLVNTFETRLIMAIASVLAEFALAVGVFLLVRQIGGQGGAVLAAVLCWLFPPLAMDSAFWQQTDAWFLAPSVFVVWFMLRRRWIAAGVLLGIAGLLKPQALLLGPVVVFACAVVGTRQKQTPRIQTVATRLLKLLGAAVVTVVVISAPWTLADGLGWIDKAYVSNFTMYGETTLRAFNVWYIGALHADRRPVTGVLDDQVLIAGTTRKSWGRLLVLVAGLLLAILTWRRYRQRPQLAVTLFAGLWLWSAFIWPTGVHERYIVYCMPLIIAAAVFVPRLWPAVAMLAVIGVAELSHNIWLTHPAGTYSHYAERIHRQVDDAPRAVQQRASDHLEDVWKETERKRRHQRGFEWLFTAISLLAYGWAVVVPLRHGAIAEIRNHATHAAGSARRRKRRKKSR